MKNKKILVLPIVGVILVVVIVLYFRSDQKGQSSDSITEKVEVNPQISIVQSQTTSTPTASSKADSSASQTDKKEPDTYTPVQQALAMKQRLRLSNDEVRKYIENNFDSKSIMIAHGLTKVTKKSVDEIIKLKTNPPKTWLQVFKELKIRGGSVMAKIREANLKEVKKANQTKKR